MKTIEEIKDEISELIREAGKQGVMLESIDSEFICTMSGNCSLTTVSIKEVRVK